MITIDIYWKDFTKEKQDEILEALNITEKDHNWDVFPITTLDIEEDAFGEN